MSSSCAQSFLETSQPKFSLCENMITTGGVLKKVDFPEEIAVLMGRKIFYLFNKSSNLFVDCSQHVKICDCYKDISENLHLRGNNFFSILII